MTARCHHRFTFLEVLVAVIVCGVLLSVIMASVSQSLHDAGLAEDYTQAALLARSHLAELSVASHLEAGSTGGNFGSDNPRFSWRQTVKPAPQPHGFVVDVYVSFERQGEVRETHLSSWLPDPAALVKPEDADGEDGAVFTPEGGR